MFKLTFNPEILAKLSEAKAQLDQRQASLLQEIGTFILQEQKFSFEDKSRGGTGADGKSWKPLAESTEIKKASRKASFRNAKKAARKIKAQLQGELSATKRKALVSKWDKARKTLAGAKSQIGVDRGLLRNSIKQGYSAPDGKGGNIFIVDGTRVTVGYGRSYARHFDAVRKLMPDDSNPPRVWTEGCDKIVLEWMNDILGEISL